MTKGGAERINWGSAGFRAYNCMHEEAKDSIKLGFHRRNTQGFEKGRKLGFHRKLEGETGE